MTVRERLGLPVFGGGLNYGEPYETSDGATIITVTGTGGLLGPRPLGIFVVRADKVKWEPAVDMSRIALLGVLTGLISAVLGTAAVLRRPPWPDTAIRIVRRS
ncbi:hypothetical protein [Nocardia aurantiaca]|uniref:Uncharacterized protein n=1 Tax=Nocardia aurantiaca TaxID=2675850 RepID=A0A6I3KP56_9NOCA|nr:hypothetical protein [Nocardia aurantiaca]MTE12363.1 hypothetical protein [Nocardia aurantiaca]